jgi:cyclic dehypoxanthinyl futalosine synthase
MSILEAEAPTLPPTLRGPVSDIRDIAEKVFAGERLTREDGLRLFVHPNLNDLALMADFVRRKHNPENLVTYVVGRNVNYTNVCWVRCSFCNFYRVPGEEGGYVLPKEAIYQKLQEMVDVGGVEVLMQGGLNPKLKIEWYEDLLSDLRERRTHLYQENQQTEHGRDADPAQERGPALDTGRRRGDSGGPGA